MVNLSKAKYASEEQVSLMINEALKDQRADFSVQIRGLFNIIMILNKQIEALEKRMDNKEKGNKPEPTSRPTTSLLRTASTPKRIESKTQKSAGRSQSVSKAVSFTSAGFGSSSWKK
jgi:hypothetical protein